MPAQDDTPPLRRRRARWLIALVAMLVLLALALRWVSQPSQVAGLILDQAGKALGLEITAGGASEYRLRGTPMLVVRDVVAKQPGTGTPLLRAERIAMEVPWATIRAAGDDLTVTRLELDAPQLDVAALQRWQATRPPSKTRIPTLTDGLRIVRGRVVGDGWSLQALDIDLPRLYPDRAVTAHVRGRVDAGATRVPLDLRVVLTRPAAGAGVGVHGDIAIESAPWSVPMVATLSARLHDGDDGIGLDRLRMSAQARYRNGATEQSFALGLATPLRFRDGTLRMAPLGIALRSQQQLPDFDAHGALALGDTLALQLQGRIATWPQGWPALPPPIGQSTSPLPFALDYRGRSDLSDIAALKLQRDATAFDGRFRLPAVLDWIDAIDRGSPLPPIAGQLTTPRIEVAGATLEGVEVEFGDETIPQ